MKESVGRGGQSYEIVKVLLQLDVVTWNVGKLQVLSPALAEGDLGIAMGAIGSDIAINSASIALMTNDLRRIPMLIDLSQKSRMVIYQNLVIGILFVFGGMVLLVFDKMTPVGAAILYTLSTLVVIFNSARLVRTGEELTLEENKNRNKK